jgi:hypothetical protein
VKQAVKLMLAAAALITSVTALVAAARGSLLR